MVLSPVKACNSLRNPPTSCFGPSRLPLWEPVAYVIVINECVGKPDWPLKAWTSQSPFWWHRWKLPNPEQRLSKMSLPLSLPLDDLYIKQLQHASDVRKNIFPPSFTRYSISNHTKRCNFNFTQSFYCSAVVCLFSASLSPWLLIFFSSDCICPSCTLSE